MPFEPSIDVISFSPYQQYHLLLCELDDAMFIVDCGWPATTTPPHGSQQPSNKTRRGQQDSSEDIDVDVRRILDTVNWSRIDFILVSNYEQMVLLPYITEYTEFSGPIYATEPTKTYGKCVLETTSQLLGLYSGSRDIMAAMEKTTDVRYDEVVSPVSFVQAYTKSSGYCIGGANWVVEYKNHRTVFVSSSAMTTCLHPREWDQRVLEGANAVVFCDVAEPNEDEDEDEGQVSQRLGQICSMALGTMKQRGGRVMLIGDPYGVTQDIFQMVAENTLALNLPLPHFVFVSGIAERTLQYGNIMGEWLCERRQAMLYIPEYPFMDKELRQKGQVHFVKSLADLATRKIPHQAVSWFVVVPSNDPETIDHFVRMWKREEAHRSMDSMGASKYSIISHDPDMRRAQRLAETLACGNEMSLVPVSLRLAVRDVERILQGMAGCTQHVIVPSHAYARISKNPYEFELTEYAYLQTANAQLDTDRHLPLDVRRGVTQKMRASGKQHALVSGNLSLVAGKIRLEVDETDGKENTAGENKIMLGQWTAEGLAKALKNSEGIAEAAVVPGSQKVRIAASGGGSAIVTVDGKWSVDCTSVDIQWIILDALKQVL